MRALVAGATGFVGVRLAERLLGDFDHRRTELTWPLDGADDTAIAPECAMLAPRAVRDISPA